jgi:hypothetical protein
MAKVWDKHPDAGPTPACDAYTGSPFKVNRAYAERFGDSWVILSAKFGYLWPGDPVPGPYNVTFKRRSPAPISAGDLRRQVADRHLDSFDRVIALGGRDYRSQIEAAFAGIATDLLFPFSGMPLGVSLGAAKRAVTSGRPF